MAVIGNTPTSLNLYITKSTDTIITITCVDSDSNAFDISGYEFYFVVRKKQDISSEKVIEILNADITQSDSGTGTTDTFAIDITNSLTNITPGNYYYEIRSSVVASGDNDVWFNGYFYIGWTVQGAR